MIATKVGMLVATLALLDACSNRVDDIPAQQEQPRPKPAASLDQAQQSNVDSAWAAFVKLNQIYVKAGQTGTYDWNADESKRPMFDYAGGRYLAALEHDLDFMNEQGLVRTGDPKVTLRRVMSVSENSILLEACVDDTGTDTVSKETHKSVAASGQNRRYPVTLRAGLYPDGLWRWVESYAERGASC